MKIFAISDTHFNHQVLTERGFRPDGFGQKILNNLFCSKGDILIHCGDFCIGNDKDNHRLFMFAACGFKKKILVRGNHDNKSDQWYYDNGWDFVCDTFTAKMFGQKIIFTHIPVEKTAKFDFNIHGHLHGNNHRDKDFCASLYDREWHKDTAPECNDYWPVNIEKII